MIKKLLGQDKPCLIFNFNYDEDHFSYPFGHKFYDESLLWGDIDEISYTLSRLPIFKLSDNNKLT